jgi:hypothetical protein
VNRRARGPHVIEANLGNRSDLQVEVGLSDVIEKRDPDLIHECEAGDRLRANGAVARKHGWKLFLGDGTPGAASVPFLINPRAKIHGHGTKLAVKRRKVGRGAGPSMSKTKVINWLVIEIDGYLWLVLGTHMIASANRWYGVLRRRHYRAHIAAIVELVNERRVDRVLLVMDGNCDPRKDRYHLLDPLEKAGLRQVTRGATHDMNLYDHAWTNEGGDGEPFQAPSDHRWVDVQTVTT